MKTNNFIYRYYTPEYLSNRVSVVGKDGKLKISASRCSDNDNFDKKLGRSLAEKRLANNNFIATISISKCSISTFRSIAYTLGEIVRNDARILKNE
jgi:hypothetical protein